jgi:hypothetical protein
MLDGPILLHGFGPHVTQPDKPAINFGWTLQIPVIHVPFIDWRSAADPDKRAGAALIAEQ